MMKFIILGSIAAMVLGRPQYLYGTPDRGDFSSSEEDHEVVSILKDERTHEGDGTYSFDFETANGIRFQESGSPDGEEDAVVQAGQYSYTAPDGTEVELKYVADENGFQPESDLLPVAPEFPHEIPQFVIDQINKAAEEDAEAAAAGGESEEDDSSEESKYAPRRRYGSP
ncbi:cuticle protein AMP1A-like [Macrobrachium rosenbergii]|uniref:cuticle protein AMP1A-like n=1 Tax=Macrobrachium rosenbergii TaxID=79674 RepID=UPI0034D4444E